MDLQKFPDSKSMKAEAANGFITGFANGIDLSVHDRIDSLKAEWKAAETSATVSVYQRYEWVEAYLKSLKGKRRVQPFIIVGRYKGEVVFILPCQLNGRIIRRLKFIGGKHVNFNLPIIPERYVGMMTQQCFAIVYERVRELVPGIGYLAFCCQPESWKGVRNPVISIAHQRSANPAFVLDLAGGFDETLARGNGKRKRKKFRQQCRQVEAFAGYQLIKPNNAREVGQIIDIFFEQKSRRLNEMGVRDVFAEASVRDFLLDMALRSLDMDSPLLQLYALKVGDDIAAVFGAGIHNKHLSGYFSSVDIDKYAELSPGEMLLYLIVEDACSNGFTELDLGAGDERYKRSWSSEKVNLHDLYLAFNWMSMPVVFLRRNFAILRRRIREDERIWQTVKTLRRFTPLNLN
jgi:CelD/BcsL family acetyltransferase involved in cellulose biosynthesis